MSSTDEIAARALINWRLGHSWPCSFNDDRANLMKHVGAFLGLTCERRRFRWRFRAPDPPTFELTRRELTPLRLAVEAVTLKLTLIDVEMLAFEEKRELKITGTVKLLGRLHLFEIKLDPRSLEGETTYLRSSPTKDTTYATGQVGWQEGRSTVAFSEVA